MSMAMALGDGRHAQTWTRSLVLDLQVLLFLTAGLLHLALVAVVFAVGAANLQRKHQSQSTRSEQWHEQAWTKDFRMWFTALGGFNTFYECPLIMSNY